jgi:hypothetical protein
MRTKIYALRENGFVRYVGKTNHSLENRLGAHLQDARKGVKSYKCNWIRSMLRKGQAPTITTLEEVGGNGSADEKEWIAYFRSYRIKLTNGTEGGDGGDTFRLKSGLEKQIFRNKMSKITKGRVVSLETRRKIGITLKGHEYHPLTPEGRKRTIEKLTRLRRSLETRARMSKAQKGRKCTWGEKIGFSNKGKIRTDASKKRHSVGQVKRWRVWRIKHHKIKI